jgi:hypothetical protein
MAYGHKQLGREEKAMRRSMVAVLAVVMAVGFYLGSATPAHAAAQGYHRNVNVWLLSVVLDHTYEYLDGYGYETFSGGTTGGYAPYNDTSTSSADTACFQRDQWDSSKGSLDYLTDGVCHQGTNRALRQTWIPYVKDWGVVDGAGTSYTMFCTFGLYWKYLVIPYCRSSPC